MEVRDKAGHVYKFGNFRAGSWQAGHHPHRQGQQLRHQCQHAPVLGPELVVWNNNGDKVILRRADGSLKDTCSYSGVGSKKSC
jgi:hypothetical protein